MVKRIFASLSAFVLLCPVLSAQTRVTLGKNSAVQSVEPTERPAAAPYSAADSAQYERLVVNAYRALRNDSFAIAKIRMEKALKLIPKHPSNPELFFQMGQIEERESRYQVAVDCYSRALALTPRYPKALLRRGGMYLLLNNRQAAINDYSQILKHNSTNPEALFFRGCAYADAGQSEAARHDFQTILEDDPFNARTLYSLALLEQHTGSCEQALDRLNGLVSRFPNVTDYYVARAGVEETMGSNQAAETDWKRALELTPQDGKLMVQHAQYLARQGRRSEAYDLLDKAEQYGVPATQTQPLREAFRKMKKKG